MDEELKICLINARENACLSKSTLLAYNNIIT